MIPEFGQVALILATLLATLLAFIPLVGSFTGNVVWMSMSRSLSVGFFIFVAIAFALLSWSFYVDDFSVKYVAGHSNTLLPVYYKLSAVWGGHEGSLLLWGLILAGWTISVALFSKNLPLDVLARVLSVMGMIAIGFMLFLIITSNPFDRILPNIPSDGSDLNPLLQDPGLIFHPPMLYMGYVGFSVVFSFAIAALIAGKMDASWARWARPWTNTAWAFLTFGLALGSWWAYAELGWGGWWFWDPVENAAFMPWLVGTALIHSLAMSEQRGVFKNWTLLLAIFAFSLSLLGTFLVRSGVLTSVHAFASDPARGIFILMFLAVVVGGSLTLFAFRAPAMKSKSGFTFLSREAFLLCNSIVMIVSANMVLLGTLYPLIADALGLGKYSVGAPYFNLFFTKLMGIIALLMGTGLMLNWKKTDFNKIRKWQLIPLLFSVWLGSFLPGILSDDYSISAAITIFLGTWVISSSISDFFRKAQTAKTLIVAFKRLTPSYYGQAMAHIGFAITLLGASLNTTYSDQRDLRLSVGESIVAAGYLYELVDVERVQGPNYSADIAEIKIMRKGKVINVLTPEKRRYFSGGNEMTEAAVDIAFFRDLYVALGEKLGGNDWAVRIHYKPVVRWIWFGAMLVGLGGLLAVADKRYKKNFSGDGEQSSNNSDDIAHALEDDLDSETKSETKPEEEELAATQVSKGGTQS